MRLPPNLAALGWLATPGRQADPHLALPTDLFMVTVHRSRPCAPRSDADDALDLAVTLLRTRPERFRSSAAGELAYALLTPAGLVALLRAPLDGQTDRRLQLAQYCSPAELRDLRGKLLAAPAAAARTLVFGAWIEARLNQRHRLGWQQQRVAEAATRIQHAPGNVTLDVIRRELNVSPRQLERDFRLWLGISPAGYSRVARFQRAAAALASGQSLSHVAAQVEFADQAHLSRGFRQLSSLSPRQFVSAISRPISRADQRQLAGRWILVDAPVDH
jgi:AraC-like DNA-binding protein